MTSAQWFVSACLLGHVLAVGLTIVPPPTQFAPPSLTRSLGDPLAATIAPVLDAAAGHLDRALRAVWRITADPRDLASGYIRAIGLLQDWRMFWNPSRSDEYLRIRFHVRSRTSVSPDEDWTAEAVVMPAHPAEEVRGLWASRLHPQDKAIRSAIRRFETRERDLGPAVRLESQPEALHPVTRFFSRQFASDRLGPDDQLARVELWLGGAPNRAPGEAEDSSVAAERQRLLDRYYRRALERAPPMAYARPGATEREGDIVWAVVYAGEP